MASDADAERYLLIRTGAESERLDTQHHVFQKHLGFLLHPDIPQPDHMRVADIGTGTGVWLRDLAETLPETCIFDGFDISLDQVPDRKLFPKGINYYVQDLLAPFPAEFLGQYDAVHVRLLVMGLKVDEWERAILNLITLLRTGGYLQWTDIAALETTVVPGIPSSNVDSANRFLKQFQKVVSSHGKSGKNVVDLCPHFKKCGLKDCKEDIVPLDIPEYTSVVNENFVKALEHILQAASLAADQVDDTLSMNEIALLRESAVKNLEDTKSRFRGVLHVLLG
ncbi:hypothetical protein AJ78_04904 [Emergomyces pasteurianus Ep9510]|uniref:Uncharacterized protein n=1 Tax=Emergomyces pasteurianus Ep9510 TaxID=1447872 RepID=A0A1J9PFL8_9EURO|nr:hypothetical protein AJ78_04904 [Emergomyces pasteurianus Ep9510]